MLPHDCQIITDDMLLTSSHLHVALHIGSLAPWRRAYLDPLSPSAHLESGCEGTSVCRVPSQLCPGECRHSLVTSSHSRFVSFLSLRLPFSVRWCAHRKKKRRSVCIRSPNALCQLAVPAVSVEIRLSADVLSVWQRVASPSILKGLPLPRGTGSR